MSETDSNSMSQRRSQTSLGAATATRGHRADETPALRRQSSTWARQVSAAHTPRLRHPHHGRVGQAGGGLRKRGVVPESGGTWILPRLIGWAKASELIFTGRTLGADECLQWGLANAVVPDAELMDSARAMAREIADNAPLAVQAAKRMMRIGQDETFNDHVHHALPATAAAVQDTGHGRRHAGLHGQARTALHRPMNRPSDREARPPFRRMNWLPRDIAVDRQADSVIMLRSRIPLQPIAPHIPSLLHRWASERPDHPWLAQRKGPDRQWLRLGYAQAKARVDALTQALLDLGVPAGRSVAILSGNSIDCALFTLAAMQAGMPYVPVTPAYSLLSQDHAKLCAMFALIDPAVVFVQSGRAFERALRALPLAHCVVVVVDQALEMPATVAWADILRTAPRADVDTALSRLTPDTVGKILFTSGSTGIPKAVIR